MTTYDRETIEILHGDTPREKHENIKAVLSICERICYPRRGTADDGLTIEEVANLLCQHIKNPNL